MILGRGWVRIFLVGLVLWAATVVVTLATQNARLVPTIVFLGSFLVPVTVVYWAFEHRERGHLSVERILSAFLAGGVLGLLGAAVLESYLLSPTVWMFLFVGLIEEGIKLVVLAWLGAGVKPKTLRDGMVLGSAVGFGFAAFETAGYAFTALLSKGGSELSISDLVVVQLIRGVVAPVGQGLWTAIVGGVLFSAAGYGRYRLTFGLVLSYLGVVVLHALWDSAQMIDFWLLDLVALVFVAAVGVAWLFILWRRRATPSAPIAPPAE